MAQTRQDPYLSENMAEWDEKNRFHDGADFQELRHRYRLFVFPVIVAALGWYLFYVVCSVYAPGVANRRVFSEFNVAFLLGLSQFALTFAVTYLYSRHAERRLEPLARRIRVDMLEAGR